MPLRLIEWRLFPAGGVGVVYAGARPDDQLLVGDASGVLIQVEPVVEVFGHDTAPDLLGAWDAGVVPWVALDGRSRVEPSLSSDAPSEGSFWRLAPGADGQAADFRIVDALGRDEWPVTSGALYRLEAPVAGPITGELKVKFTAPDGGAIELEDQAAAFPICGERFAVSILAPDRATGMSAGLEISKPMLVGRPSWRAAGASEDPLPETRLSLRGLERLRAWSGEGAVVRVRAPVPAAFATGQAQALRIVVRRRDGADPDLELDELWFAPVPDVQLLKMGIERASVVRLVGRLREPVRRYLQLQLVIDGRSGPVQVVKAAANGKFDARLPIPPEWLDGRLHAIEARQAESQAVLFAGNERTAAFHTRWAVLQEWAQPPLSAELSPAAGRHLRSLEIWAQRAAAGLPVPDVTALHDELLGGVRRRSAYPALAFEPVEAPVVSVIVPAHNKFEVTYNGLCSLLFAPVQASFEVVLVDDGSTDRTAQIEQVVSGLRVVRHESAQGFVAACNDGAAQARGDFVCFLNNDTEVTAGWLDALLAPFSVDPSTGLTGAKLIYPDGRLQEAGGIVWGTGDPWNAGRGGDPEAPAWNYRRTVDYLSGAAILTPVELWRQLGGFGQEWSPAYFEDTDFAMKVRAAGRRVLYAPDAEVYHLEGQTSGVDKTQGAKRHQELNRPRFKAKWADLYSGHGQVVGERPDLEKDRGVTGRALVIAESLKADAKVAEAAARLQAKGYKVTLLPVDGTWREATQEWGRLGVEALFAPYFDPLRIADLAPDLDLVLVADGARVGPLEALLRAVNPTLHWASATAPE